MATKKENETALKNAIKKLLKLLNIPFYSNPQGLGAVRGRPDLEAIYQGVTYYIECKHPRGGGKMSQYQKTQRAKIEAAGAPYIHAVAVEDVITALNLPVRGLL